MGDREEGVRGREGGGDAEGAAEGGGGEDEGVGEDGGVRAGGTRRIDVENILYSRDCLSVGACALNAWANVHWLDRIYILHYSSRTTNGSLCHGAWDKHVGDI